jgi:hypothetical protein
LDLADNSEMLEIREKYCAGFKKLNRIKLIDLLFGYQKSRDFFGFH